MRRPLTDEELEGLRVSADNYYEYKETYLAEPAVGPTGRDGSA